MFTPAYRIEYSFPDYGVLEASSNVKHEYLAGRIYAMAGGTPEHAALESVGSRLSVGELYDAAAGPEH